MSVQRETALDRKEELINGNFTTTPPTELKIISLGEEIFSEPSWRRRRTAPKLPWD